MLEQRKEVLHHQSVGNVITKAAEDELQTE